MAEFEVWDVSAWEAVNPESITRDAKLWVREPQVPSRSRERAPRHAWPERRPLHISSSVDVMSVEAYDQVPFTELLREPSATAGRLRDTRRLRLRRRDAEDLMLQSAERAAREDEVIDLSARLLAGFVHDADGARILHRILPQALPWVTFLPVKAVDALVEELVATLRAAVSIDNLWPVSQLLVEWRHTAEIYADPALYAAATRLLGDGGGPVPRPEPPESVV
jgi:phytoene dehydrogenase-like protein